MRVLTGRCPIPFKSRSNSETVPVTPGAAKAATEEEEDKSTQIKKIEED
jgi:hypothetical protein